MVTDGLSELDPTAADIMAEFPAWNVWEGVNHLLYGQHRGSPPLTFRDENGTELRAQIAAWERTNTEPELGNWPKPPWKASR